MSVPKKILVTGGGGFIGSEVVARLMRFREESGQPLEIVSMDLLPSPIEGADHHVGSILDSTDIAATMQGCDAVIHLAALLGVENSEKRRLDCLRINIQGTVNILHACALEKVNKLIFVSSSEVYGDQQTFPISETNPVNPKSVYAVTKLAGEEYVRAFAERYDFDYTILRLFNSYGSSQVGQFVITRFVQAVLQDEAPELSGDGSQTRAFCHGRDIAEGVLLALQNEKSNGEIINLGNDKEPISIKELAKRVIQLSGKTGIEPRSSRPDQIDRKPERDIMKRIPDISKARTLLGYEPQVPLEQGIKELLERGEIVENWPKRGKTS